MAKLPLLMQRRASTLVPMDGLAEEQLWAFPERQDFNVAITYAGKESPRRGANRKYWAGLGLMARTTELWPTSRKLHELILDSLGYTTKRYKIDHSYVMEPDSISFEQMQDSDFFDFFERARMWMLSTFDVDPWFQWEQEMEARKH